MTDFTPQSVMGPDDLNQFPDSSPPPLSKWQKIKDFYFNNKWYVWAIIAGVIIIAILIALALWPRKSEPSRQAKVQVSIEAPEVAQASGEIIYKVKVLNQDPAKLVGMNLELVYDEGVRYISSSPKAENLSGSSFVIPDLTTGQNAVIIIKALVNGNVNDTKKLVVRLRYRFDNFSSSFSVESSKTIRLLASDVVLDMSGPEKANNSEVVKYEVFYRNSSKKDIENVRLEIEYPPKFEFASSDPVPSLAKNIWNLGTLNTNQTGKVTFEGSFRLANPGEGFNFTAKLLALDNSGNFFVQSSSTYSTEISSRPLSADLKILNNQSGIVEPGAGVSLELKFQNNTAVVHSGVQIVAQIESGYIDSKSIKSETGFVQDQTITWNASVVSLLERLNPNDSGTVKFQFNIADPATKSNAKDLVVNIKARIKSNQHASFIPGDDIKLKISSPAGIGGEVESISGSLPPKVGQQNIFRVSVDLSNSSNDLKDAILIGFVPIGTSLVGESFNTSERALVKFDSSTGKITWNVGRVLAHTGFGKSGRVLEFSVRHTPTNAQVGQSIVLFKNIIFSAVDEFTGQNIELELDQLGTNNLPDGSSLGRVSQ